MPAWAGALVGMLAAWLGHHYAPKPATACPPLTAYTVEQEHALADAIRALPPDDPLVGMTADYIALRKACKGARP